MGRLNFENKTENRRNLESKLEKRKEEFVRNNLLSDEFIEFVQKNKKPFDTLMSYYQCAIMEVETKFKVLSEEYSLEYDRNPIENIKSRVKSFDSLLKKIRRKNIPLTMTSIEENIQDDIYRLADCLLSQDDIILLEKKDYIKNPKPSGYRSLHLIIQTPIFLQEGKRMVTVEVQLRTIAMDFWASLEHKLRYKKNISEEQSAFLAEEMSQCAEISASLDERMQKVKDMLIQSEEESKEPEKPTRLLNLINR